MDQPQHLAIKTVEHVANAGAYGGAAATLGFWGLHVSDVCAIVSTVVAVLGFGLQCYVYWRKAHPR